MLQRDCKRKIILVRGINILLGVIVGVSEKKGFYSPFSKELKGNFWA
jgi:hypothetical protein